MYTKYANTDNALYPITGEYLETPGSDTSSAKYYVWAPTPFWGYVSSNAANNNKYGIRPTIDVPKSKLQ